MTRRQDNIPVLKGTVSIRNPRDVFLLVPFQVILASILLLLSLVFTVWPDALQHSPIGFEQQGLIHHFWHYALMGGALLTLVGMFVVHRHRTQIELVGLTVLTGALLLNLVSILTDYNPDTSGGLDVAYRSVIILWLITRILDIYFDLQARVTVHIVVDNGQ